MALTLESKPNRDNYRMEAKRQSGRKRHSCEECRRLKMKCDNMVPCANCTKRGIQTICPTGVVSGSWRKNRVVLANTEQLHIRIEQLSERIRELEEALATLQANTINEPHPLLSHELLQLKAPLGVLNQNDESIRKVDEALTDSCGTLTISPGGVNSFYGSTAVSGFLEIQATNKEHSVLASIPNSLNHTSFLFTNGSRSVNGVPLDDLPSPQEAWRLCRSYFENAAWLYNIITEEELTNDIFAPIYDGFGGIPTDIHFSILWSTMALGAQADPLSPLNNTNADRYYRNAETALASSNILQSSTLLGIYAVFNLCFYLHMSHLKEDIERCIILQGVMIKMAQSMGLHHDPTKFDLPENEVSRRRRVFWEIYLFDIWLSFNVGRPPTISHTHVDTQMPLYPEENGSVEGFHRFKHEFTQKNLRLLVDKPSLTGRPLAYSKILQLDKTIRSQAPYPASLRVPGLELDVPLDTNSPSLGKTMQRHILFTIRELLFFYLHRRFFAHALRENPFDPLKGAQFSLSVLATYSSSIKILSCLRHCYTVEPQATIRRVWLWNHGYSALVVLAAIVTLSPLCSLAASALIELEAACELFAKAKENRLVATKLHSTQRLLQRARIAYETRETSPDLLKESTSFADLSGMNGATRLIWLSPSPEFNRPIDDVRFQLPTTASICSPIDSGASSSADFPSLPKDTPVERLDAFSNTELYGFYSAHDAWNLLNGLGEGNQWPLSNEAPFQYELAVEGEHNSMDEVDWQQLISQLGADS